MRDTRTVLLGLLSLGLVATWVYHLYDKTKYTAASRNVPVTTESSSIRSVQDSLQNLYTTTLNTLGAQLDSAKNTAGLLQSELIAKLDEINKLKTEINDLLRKNNAGREDMDLAGKKTAKFQQLVADLPKKNNTQPAETKETSSAINGNDNQVAKNTLPTTGAKLPATTLFTASDLKFIPIRITEDREEETNEAVNTDKLIISFAVRNNADIDNAEIFAVITQPDGKVMQTDFWESASIYTHDFGKKIYTRKVRFEYQKGETKQLQLTLRPEDYEKGNYRLQVFHNGYLIGETVKRLN